MYGEKHEFYVRMVARVGITGGVYFARAIDMDQGIWESARGGVESACTHRRRRSRDDARCHSRRQ